MTQFRYADKFKQDESVVEVNKTSWVNLTLTLILVFSGLLMFNAARTDSMIMDELAHIPSGYGYIHNFDYRLNPEHPPLLKALAALPLLIIRPNFPTNNAAWQTELNGQWDMGAAFIYGSGNNPDQIVFLARIFPMLLTLLTAFLVFLIAKRLFGEKWALLPAALFALSPNILAHGHYVTTDIAATFGILLSLWAFLDYLSLPSKKRLVWAGIAFGIAQLLKFSAVLLAPYFIAFVLIFAFFEGYRNELPGFVNKLRVFWREGIKKIWSLIIIFVIGYAVIVYPIYFLFTLNYPQARQTSDTVEILKSFANGPTQPGKTCSLMRCVAEGTILATKNPVTRPLAHYTLGVLMVMQRSDGGNTAYYDGELSNRGSTGYFPTVFALKETIPTLIFLLFGLLLAVLAFIKSVRDKTRIWRIKVLNYFDAHMAQIMFAGFAAFYWYMSMRSPLNIGFRHIMPTIPLFYLLMTGAWKNWFESGGISKAVKGVLFAGLICWFILETCFASPYFLSYFNEFGGSIGGGYRYVTDSNYDWGQDLFRLKDWVKAHPEVDKLALDFFGGGTPSHYMPEKVVSWWSAKGNPANQGIHYFAISINNLQGDVSKLAPVFLNGRNPVDEYQWLQTLKSTPPGMGQVPTPDYRVGTTIFIYKL